MNSTTSGEDDQGDQHGDQDDPVMITAATVVLAIATSISRHSRTAA
jgi:hypothetical protein